MGIIILKTDGTITDADFPIGTIREQTKGLAALIGCEHIERVRPTRAFEKFGFPKTVNMIVDEEGALKEDRVLNKLASALHDGDIFGTVLFCGEKDTADGPVFCKMDDDDYDLVSYLIDLLKETDKKGVKEIHDFVMGKIGSLKGELLVKLNGYSSHVDGSVNSHFAFAFAAYVLLAACEKEFGVPFDMSIDCVKAINEILDCETQREPREMTISVAELLKGGNDGQQSSGTEEQKEG